MLIKGKKNMSSSILGIDASNIRAGGGVTHLSRLLSAASLEEHGFKKVIVWSGRSTLDQLPDREWLEKIHSPILDKISPFRLFWQQCLLSKHLRKYCCTALFSPGGIVPKNISIPSIVMSQNLLPFEPREAARFSLKSGMRLKMKLLHKAQTASMRRAKGVIFLSAYAHQTVMPYLRKPEQETRYIPHGIDQRFFLEPRLTKSIREYSKTAPFRILYVSTIDVYKHQWNVALAVARLRKMGLPVQIDFVGTARREALNRLSETLNRIDPKQEFARYAGSCCYEKLPPVYGATDLFVFASSCENLPIIVLEAMAAGLPIACSNRGPMPEVLGDSAVYFNPEMSQEIEVALLTLIENPELRNQLASEVFTKAKTYSWNRCANETFSFLAEVAQEAKNRGCIDDE